MSTKRKSIGLVGYACDFGGTVAGSGLGPKVLREMGLADSIRRLGWDLTDYGDVEKGALIAPPVQFSEGESSSKNFAEVYSACAELNQKVKKILSDGHIPLVLGGDHSTSIGSVPAVADYYAQKGENIGLLWVDAHPDINTPETSPSGRFFGMSVAALLGLMPGALSSLQQKSPAIKFENLAFIGLRDVDPDERTLINARCSKGAFPMGSIDGEGIKNVLNQALEIVLEATSGVVLSFDLDVCDPNFAPGTGTPKRGGLTYRESRYLLEKLADSGKLVAIEFVEFNPTLDRSGQTAEVALSLIQSVLGERIL
jgi:arginase